MPRSVLFAAVALLFLHAFTGHGYGYAQQSIPTPESVIGFAIGDDFKLASYDQSIAYFRALDEASDRVRLVEVGRTSEGRAWFVALISDADNLANVERYREISKRLAHPEDLTDEEARALAREGKAIVAIDGGLHSSETAHGQHTIQLAYDLVSEKDGDVSRGILENVILVLWPSLNPDGQEMIVDWYNSNLGTPYEISSLPRLYQKYIGHDNNRDGYGLNMIESRASVRVNRYWEPQVMYSHHMTSPFPATIWLPPYADPIHPYAHPLINRTMSMIGMAAAQMLDERGLPGATHMGTGYDAWYPGYIDFVNLFHNVVIMFSETGLHGYATPRFYSVSDFPQEDRALNPGTLHSSLWKGGWWRLKNSVDMMLTASTATLDVAAKYRENILYNRYQAGRDVIALHTEGPPYAYFIPQQQRDPVAAAELLRRLAFHDIEIHQLFREAEYQGRTYPAGTWVIPMARANASLARALLTVQDYPEIRVHPEAPADQPYDVAGWTLPYQMNVRVMEAATPLDADVLSAMAPVRGEATPWSAEEDPAPFDMVPGPGFNTNAVAAGILPLPGRLIGSGSHLSLDASQNNAFRAVNRAWDQGARVSFAPGRPGAEGGPGSGGRYVVSGLGTRAMETLVSDLALQAQRTGQRGTYLSRPRVGLYRPWRPSIDEGWTRWLFEMFDFEFQNLFNADIVAGELKERVDVIVIPDMRDRQILEGAPVGTMPPRYTGGIGAVGVRALDAFVRAGGTLVCLNGSTGFAIDALHLPVKDVVAELDNDEFYIGGSILEVTVDPSHPVMTGMPERSKIMFSRSPVFTGTEAFEGRALAKYQKLGSPLLSGYLLGEEHLHGYAAALDVFHGDGHVILLGFRPQWRAQSYGTFPILFNAALYSDELAGISTGDPGFWTPPRAEDEGGEGEGG
ncbi:MAG: M14 family metallopeptidase [Gemmatimonadota bacterium]|jgi:hypothetical protein